MPLARGGCPVRRTFTGTASRRLLREPPRTLSGALRALIAARQDDACRAAGEGHHLDRVSTIDAMQRLLRKDFARPDRLRPLGSGTLELVDLDETTVGQVVLPPGWRWSVDVQPVVGTASCQTRHVAYAISATLHVAMDDGT